jgi:hypothetical protein
MQMSQIRSIGHPQRCHQPPEAVGNVPHAALNLQRLATQPWIVFGSCPRSGSDPILGFFGYSSPFKVDCLVRRGLAGWRRQGELEGGGVSICHVQGRWKRMLYITGRRPKAGR